MFDQHPSLGDAIIILFGEVATTGLVDLYMVRAFGFLRCEVDAGLVLLNSLILGLVNLGGVLLGFIFMWGS